MAKSNLADMVLSMGLSYEEGATDEVVDIITFVESPMYMGTTLYPAQRVFLKAHYGLPLVESPLDLSEEDLESHPLEVLQEMASQEIEKLERRRKDDRDYLIRVILRKTVLVHVGDAPWRKDPKAARWLSEADYLRFLYDNGRCNIREVIPGVERRELILSVGRRSGKCVTGETLVLTDRGVKRMDELGDPNGPEFQPLELTVAQEGSRKSKSAQFYNGGTRPIRKFRTCCGYQLAGTDNHRIKVLGEDGTIQWRYFADLKVGDQVGIHRKSDLWSSSYVQCSPQTTSRRHKGVEWPEVLTEKWGNLLGYLVGDGCWSDTTCVSITVEHSETIQHLKDLMQGLFGSEPKWCPDKRTKGAGSLRENSAAWQDFLHNLGFSQGSGPYDKEVPWSILQSPKSVVCAFLRGLFEADGGVEKGGQVVSFSSASSKLIHGVQVLLANLGIISRVSSRWNPTLERHHPYLVLRGQRSRAIFAALIGFDSTKKHALLQDVVCKDRGHSTRVPNQRAWCQRLLESVPEAKPGQGWNRSTLREALGNVIKPSSGEELTDRKLRRTLRVARALGCEGSTMQHFGGLLDADYFWDPVEEITESVEKVYDLVVPDGVSFVANAMTNHNTHLSSCVAAYETYKLISKNNPQRYYGLPEGEVIQLISVATDRDQAGILYRKVSAHFKNTRFFRSYTANETQTNTRFQTPKDITDYGKYTATNGAHASLNITFRSCVAKGLRGAGNIVVILDEVAHFTGEGQSSAEEVYNAVKPSMSTMSQKDPDDKTEAIGDVEARMVLISSPQGKQGLFYQQFLQALQGGKGSENLLAIQAPTWEVNPSVPTSEFEQNYARDANVFLTEYGGEFSDRTLGWIEVPSDLMNCVDEDLKKRERGLARVDHFMGIDFALANDGTAVAIGHLEGDTIVLDYVGNIRAGFGDYVNHERLDYEEVADWVLSLTKKFRIQEGIFDQWSGIVFEQALNKRGLTQLRKENHTDIFSSQLFKNFKDMMFEKRLALYDDRSAFDKSGGVDASGMTLPDDEAEGVGTQPKGEVSYLKELLQLQATYKSKYVIKVQAPQVKGKHDDRSDALVRMVWLASHAVSKTGYLAGGRRAGDAAGADLDMQNRRNVLNAMKRARTGRGSHRMRQIPKAKGRRR